MFIVMLRKKTDLQAGMHCKAINYERSLIVCRKGIKFSLNREILLYCNDFSGLIYAQNLTFYWHRIRNEILDFMTISEVPVFIYQTSYVNLPTFRILII